MIAEFEDEIGGKQQQIDFFAPESTPRREEAKASPSNTDSKGLEVASGTSTAQEESVEEPKVTASQPSRIRNSRRDSVPWRDAFFAEGAGEKETARSMN